MKKAAIVIILILLVVAGVLFLSPKGSTLLLPKSEKLYKEYVAHVRTLNERRFMEEPAYRWDYQDKSKQLREQVVDAALDEKNADRAIPLLEDIIEDLGKPQSFLDTEMPITAAHVSLRAIYCEQLARAYEIKQDSISQERALKKSAALKARAAKMEQLEKKGRK